MMKKFLKIFLVVAMLLTVVGVSAGTVLANSSCAIETPSGTNRSNTCSLTRGTGTPRRATIVWNHSQFSVLAGAHSVTRGSHANARADATANNRLTSRTVTVRQGGSNSTSLTRIAFQRPISGGILFEN